MSGNRREFLGGAMAGAGLLGIAASAQAAAPNFGPGDGGVARHPVELPPGNMFVPHNPDDVAAMPAFTLFLDGLTPKVASGGWVKEANARNMPFAREMAGAHMLLEPGASREMHWHATADEWAFVLDGECQTVVLAPDGTREINNFGAGDLWYFAKGHSHSIQTVGDKPCHFVLVFNDGSFSDHHTFSLTDWVSGTPDTLLAENFGLPRELFKDFAKGETYIMAGPVLRHEDAVEHVLPAAQSHKFSLLQQKPTRVSDGGHEYLATATEFPASADMSGGVMVIKPGALRELHWHPNANEWQYFLRGTGEIALFGTTGRNKVAAVKPGDVAYLPLGYGHAIRNTGSEDLEVVSVYDNGQYQETALADWIAASPPYQLANNFGVPAATFKNFPKKSGFIRAQV